MYLSKHERITHSKLPSESSWQPEAAIKTTKYTETQKKINKILYKKNEVPEMRRKIFPWGIHETK